MDAGWADLLRSLNKTAKQLLADPTLCAPHTMNLIFISKPCCLVPFTLSSQLLKQKLRVWLQITFVAQVPHLCQAI